MIEIQKMRKSFIKFRVSRMIPTFHFCRSKQPSSLPINPSPLFLHHSSSTSTHHHHQSPNPKPPHRSSIKRHVLIPRPSPKPSHTQSSPSNKQPQTHFFNWIKPNRHHVNYDSTPPRRKIYNSNYKNDVVLLPPSIQKHRVSKLKRRRRRAFQKARISTSSDSGLFSVDDQTEILVSTTDSTSKSKERENEKRSTSFESAKASPAPARLSEFMRKMAPCRAVVEGKVRESFAVVKRSKDPYEDFKTSMVEMVVEKQMFDERELEELLRCFLSLNSERHYEAIVKAFTEIWKGLFCHSPLSHE